MGLKLTHFHIHNDKSFWEIFHFSPPLDQQKIKVYGKTRILHYTDIKFSYWIWFFVFVIKRKMLLHCMSQKKRDKRFINLNKK